MNEDQMYYEVGRLYLSLRQSEIQRNRLTALLKEQDTSGRFADNGEVPEEPVEVESD